MGKGEFKEVKKNEKFKRKLKCVCVLYLCSLSSAAAIHDLYLLASPYISKGASACQLLEARLRVHAWLLFLSARESHSPWV